MKTAVEWLWDELECLIPAECQEAYVKAKEMEKKQSEKMYSEEEVFSILDKVFHMYASNHRKDAKNWFENFKKK